MMRTPLVLGDARFFAHEAMKTTFTLRFAGMPEEEARGIARECFERVDRVEQSLSRYLEGSEVWRINRMMAGQTLYLSESCHRCLMRAVEAHQETGGLFDITLGGRIRHRKEMREGPEPTIRGRLVVHPDVPAVTCEEEGRELDLGGIGKGFALDEIADLLHEWDVSDVLLAGGASSMRAVGQAPWPVELAGERDTLKMELAGTSLSASGVGMQGAHILHPGRTGEDSGPLHRRLWVTSSTATDAEIWSTAMMLVPLAGLREWVAEGGRFRQVFLDGADGIRLVGAEHGH